ncbi:phytanoyl-CoA dioxygenase family protein [Myxococcota bacterium]|nr:phytanoyl-CoA dioxygenase family protein [Myxococcota bacterium]
MIQRFKPSDPSEEIAAAIVADGGAIIEELVPASTMDQLEREVAPWLARIPRGTGESAGLRTRRVGGLVARSAMARTLIMHPAILEIVRTVVHLPTTIQLHLTQIMALDPGEKGQPIHRDQQGLDLFTFPDGYEALCNALWAVTDFTERNGATRFIAGSNHYSNNLNEDFREEDTEPATMPRGSCLLYTGSVYHGAGANRSDATRTGMRILYSAGWLRQEENQFLSVPPEIARTLDPALLRLLGYQRGAYGLGYVDDMRDPMAVVRPDLAGAPGFGDEELLQQQFAKMRRFLAGSTGDASD